MAKRELLSPELLRQLVDYDPSSGVMVWKARSPEHFVGGSYPAERRCKSWNSRYAGTRADAVLQTKGYRTITVFGQHLLAHRSAFAIMTGAWPAADVDHLNGDKSANQWANLRDATKSTNMRNSGVRRGRSGVVGVRQNRHGTWTATVCGKHLGNYPTMEQAASVRQSKAAELGFTARHGRA